MVSAPAKPLSAAVKCWPPAVIVAARNSLPKSEFAVDGDPAGSLVSTQANSDTIEEAIRTEVITRRPDFIAANRGKRFVSPGFVLLVHKRRGDHRADPQTFRYGITVTKKIGNAVIRNRMKRRFRALIASTLDQHGIAGADHILIGRKQPREPEFAAMKADLEKGLQHLAKKF